MIPSTLTPYLYGIASNLLFGTASITFSRFARTHSATWVNQIKVTLGLIGFLIAFLITESFAALTPVHHFFLLASGFSGLFLGDYFLFKSFATLGPARTLVLYSFQPFLLGVYGYLFLSQGLSGRQMIAILCMIACVFTFILERKRVTGKPDLKAFLFAFTGVIFDAIGVALSRQSYEASPDLGPFQANATRAFGALIGFLALSPLFLKHISNDLLKLRSRDRNQILLACVFGTFLSLTFYLTALKTAHVATLTAISITSPVWVSLVEHVQSRSWPHRYLWVAFGMFLTGFWLMQS
jgi:drug/metabolite transporter (DMT)-like permease